MCRMHLAAGPLRSSGMDLQAGRPDTQPHTLVFAQNKEREE